MGDRGPNPVLTVGLGASAGGLEALERFFDRMPPDTGMAFVVVQHLSPDFKSLMDDILSRRTVMPVCVAEDGVEIAANTVYLNPPKKLMEVQGGRLRLADKAPGTTIAFPIDHFLTSLAADAPGRSAAIIFSGTGSDGSRGIGEIHRARGLVVAQDPLTAGFDGMPRAAIETGHVDLTLTPELAADAVVAFMGGKDAAALRAPEGDTQGFGAITRLLHEAFGVDFAEYKLPTIARRTERRMRACGAADLDDYARRLASEPHELDALYRDLLIGVTQFFREHEAFDLLGATLLPEILKRLGPSDELRVWVPGCATGEEAYSLAIAIRECLEALELPNPAKIFATDIHREALRVAAAGVYDESALAEVTPERRERFFDMRDGRYQVSAPIRGMVVFAPHNVLSDVPFNKLALVSCRNLLIYLQPAAQQRVLNLFNFGLAAGGLLFLGASESLADLAGEFDVIDAHWKIFRKRRELPVTRLRAPAMAAPRTARGDATSAAAKPADPSLVGVYDALLDDVMRPSILIDSRRNLVQTFGGAGRFMQVPEGRTTTDVAEMLRDDLRVAVTGALQRVLTEHRAIRYRDLRVELGGQPVLLDLTVREVRSRRSGEAYALVTFDEQRAPTAAELAAAPIAADQLTRDQVVALETQLRHTKENLQTTIEELETSNEELQATNEELMASNEELQTTNEELHSVNEELYTVNTEYQKKLAELTQVTADMDHLLASTDVHTLFLDRELRIRRFTPKMAEIFHLVPADVGRRIEAFNHVLSRAAIADDVRTVVATGQPFEQQVQHTQQGWYLLRVLPYRRGRQTEGAVLTLTDVTSLKRAEQDAQEASNRRDRFLATLSHELRNPLAAVLNASRVLTHGDLPPKEVERWHAVIMQRGEHMSRLVDDLLDVARLTQDKLVLQRQTMDLSATARGVLDEVEATYRERGITLETDFEDGVAVWGDATRLHQVQVNLLSNAARHTPAGGRVTYSVHRVDGAAEIRVADDGEGIAPEMRERIFELFVQGAQPGSRGRDGGLGVGLALVRRVTELHGGTVAVESGGAGKGAEFRVRIPLATRPVAEAAAASGRVSERPGTVLIVDDDPYIRSGMCKLFQLDDIAVRAAADGEEGLAMLTQHAPPDLVLLDIGLPRMDGYELCRRMRATPGGGDLLMFALTGFGQDSDREAATRAGFDAHLTKPVDIDEVYALYARHRGTRPERPAITIEPSPAT